MKSPKQVARRIIALIGVFQAATGRDNKKIIKILKDNGFWSDTSENEKNFLLSPKEESKFIAMQLSWRSEAIYILLWTLNHFDFSNIPKDESNLEIIKDLLTNDDFYLKFEINNVQLRDSTEIYNLYEIIYKIDSELRDAQINSKEIPNNHNPSIIYEWLYALNWLINEEEDWDYIAVNR